eukprot:CAMPEP_0202690416 /NCGR_PEP_ID=MMETSP1385-20130828/5404_1 /ASSEMBLY_ACC=CAM_ASM_000861 /TAXON_ID=933848 /ORGANISM="Elphidium margaritaceum" /LENGTH=307 /DNA_ID=CAMNT_0049345677 /DNA_START=15 /DNA_END=938 /DNA_ORIENTATION=+
MQTIRATNGSVARKQMAMYSMCGGTASSPHAHHNTLYKEQRRTKTHSLHYKMLFHPYWKRVYKHPRYKKEYMFTEDTLHSLSHGEDNRVRVRVCDYPGLKKVKFNVYPQRHVLRLWSDIMGHFLWLPVSKHAIHKINQAGSFDRYILTTQDRDLNSRLGERLRYRLLRILERREDEMIERALDGDPKAIPIAYSIVLQQEKNERKSLFRRNNWLSQMEGKQESRKRKWMRHELEHRIELIKNGVIPQKYDQGEPFWKEVQSVFDQHRKSKQLLQSQPEGTTTGSDTDTATGTGENDKDAKKTVNSNA